MPAGTTLSDAVAEAPFSDADNAAACVELTEPAVAVKLALLDPAATITVLGTVSAALFEESATVAPPLAAAAEIVTVHEAAPPDATVDGEHCNDEGVICAGAVGVTVPPDPDTAAEVPSGRTPMTPLRGSEMLEADPVAVSVTFRTATTPELIADEFMPEVRHTILPPDALQLSDFPAAERAAPAEALTEATSLAG